MEQLHEYDYIIKQFERLQTQMGKKLSLQDFVLRIQEYEYKSPRANSYAIEVPLQYINMIELICNLIFSNRNTFKNVGNCDKEKFDKEAIQIDSTILTLNDFKQKNNLIDSYKEYQPVDEQRKSFSKSLSQFIISFFCYHELGHVRQVNIGPTRRDTFHEFGYDDSNNFEDQVKEVDADVFGINLFCDHLFTFANKIKNGELGNHFKSTTEILHLAIYAIFLLFYISNSNDKIYDPKKKHPHAILRLDYLGSFLQEIFLLNEIVQDKAEFSKLMISVIKDFDITLTNVFGIKNNMLYYNRFKDPDVKRTKNVLIELIKKDPYLNFNSPYQR